MVKMAHPVEISRVLTAVAARSPKRENIKEEGCQTDKTPIAAIGDLAVTIWHEDGAVVVADKPATMAVHPADAGAANTLVNALLGCNRWLAEMETSYQPGVIYHLNPADRGLVVVAKNDEAGILYGKPTGRISGFSLSGCACPPLSRWLSRAR